MAGLFSACAGVVKSYGWDYDKAADPIRGRLAFRLVTQFASFAAEFVVNEPEKMVRLFVMLENSQPLQRDIHRELASRVNREIVAGAIATDWDGGTTFYRGYLVVTPSMKPTEAIEAITRCCTFALELWLKCGAYSKQGVIPAHALDAAMVALGAVGLAEVDAEAASIVLRHRDMSSLIC